MAAVNLPAAENLPPRLCQGLTARELLCPARENHGLEPVTAESERSLLSFHGEGGTTAKLRCCSAMHRARAWRTEPAAAR